MKCPNGYYPTSFKELVDRLHGRNGSTTLDRTIEKPLVIVPLHPGTWTSERGQKVIHTINLFMDTLLPTMFDEGTNSSTKLNPPQQSRFECFISQAFFLDGPKKTQGEKNSKLKEKTKTQAQNSESRHFLE